MEKQIERLTIKEIYKRLRRWTRNGFGRATFAFSIDEAGRLYSSVYGDDTLAIETLSTLMLHETDVLRLVYGAVDAFKRKLSCTPDADEGMDINTEQENKEPLSYEDSTAYGGNESWI